MRPRAAIRPTATLTGPVSGDAPVWSVDRVESGDEQRTERGAMTAGAGLTRVSIEELEALFRALHRGRFELPLERHTLHLMGLHGLAEHGGILVGLDARGLQSVLVAVLAERKVRARIAASE